MADSAQPTKFIVENDKIVWRKYWAWHFIQSTFKEKRSPLIVLIIAMGSCFSCCCPRDNRSSPSTLRRRSTIPEDSYIETETDLLIQDISYAPRNESRLPQQLSRTLIEEVPEPRGWDDITFPSEDTLLKPYIDYARGMSQKRTFLGGYWATSLASLENT